MEGNPVVAAVRACVGTPFRPQGRTAGLGLDCIGVAEIAARAAGLELLAPCDYVLSGEAGERIENFLAASGLQRLDPPAAEAGDLVLLMPAEGQRHLAVLTDQGFVHAHLGLRRVVETPGQPQWPALAGWRFKGEN